MDADGEIIDAGLSKVAAYRLAWRCMLGPVSCVDICHARDVFTPVVAWVRRGTRWKREIKRG